MMHHVKEEKDSRVEQANANWILTFAEMIPWRFYEGMSGQVPPGSTFIKLK